MTPRPCGACRALVDPEQGCPHWRPFGKGGGRPRKPAPRPRQPRTPRPAPPAPTVRDFLASTIDPERYLP